MLFYYYRLEINSSIETKLITLWARCIIPTPSLHWMAVTVGESNSDGIYKVTFHTFDIY